MTTAVLTVHSVLPC